MTAPLAKKLLLIGWDAADWPLMHPLIDAGRMPHLQRLVERGVIGQLATLQPVLSPVLWTSIATGKRGDQHGVHGFVEPTPDGTALRPTASTSRLCKAIWNLLSHSGQRCHAVGWFASHPAEDINGASVSQLFPVAAPSSAPDDWPVQPARVYPPELADELAEPLKGVMDAVYVFHDQMLGRLVALAGAEAHIMMVSDHGFHSGAARPVGASDPAQWHRSLGMFLLAGPGVKRDATVHGANLLDITPTILTPFGLPVGRDMEGKVLVHAFEQPPEIQRIGSWEEVPDPVVEAHRARERNSAEDDPEAAAAAMQQLVELGYIDAPDEDVGRSIVQARAAQKFNLACRCMDGHRPARALTLTLTLALALALALALELELELAQQFPGDPAYLVFAGQAAVAASDAPVLQQVTDQLAGLQPGHTQIALFRGFQGWLANDVNTALRHFEQAAQQGHDYAWLQCRIGRAYLRLRLWQRAEAHCGLSVALPRQGQLEEGVQHGLKAIALAHDMPLAHFQLGAVLARMGWYERALRAFELCLRILPHFALARRYVSQVSAKLGQAERADSHLATARRVLAEGLAQPVLD